MHQFVFRAITLTTLTLMLAATFSITPVMADTELSETELAADTVTISDSTDTIEFTLRARWGFVRGNPDNDRKEKIYDGEIIASNSALAKIRLQRTLLFEKHDSNTSQANPVSWRSKIYGHWDGVLVYVRAKANAEITVRTAKGTISKTAEEWFKLSEPAVLEIENNEMLVVNTHPHNHRRHAVLIWWGRKIDLSDAVNLDKCGTYTYSSCPTSCGKICLPSGPNITDCEGEGSCFQPATPKVDFSGILTMDEDAKIKLKKALRFENDDKIDEHDRNHIKWTSYITTGRDGLFTLMLPDPKSILNTGFSIHFTNLGEDSWYRHYTFEDIKEGIRETITIDNVDYVLVIGYKTIPQLLVKAKKSKKLYLIKDNIRHLVNDSDILSANGYTEAKAVTMADDELESYQEGDELDYPDGTIVESDNNSYLISNGVRRLLTTKNIKSRFAKAKQLIKILASSKLNKIAEGPAINSEDELPDDSLVKVEGDSAVWRIRGGKRQVFNSAKIFNLHKLNWGQIKTITKEKLQSYDWEAPVEYADGSLVKVPTDPKVYLIVNGVRRWLETEADLLGLGFQFSDIVDMEPTEIINYPEGDPVVSDETNEVIEF